MKFTKYLHLERFGNDEVSGIEDGTVFVFPKIDGTNASIWWKYELCAGSRNRELSLENDNQGFYNWVLSNRNLFTAFFGLYPNLTLFGEWLVPHTFKGYRDDAWKKFYLFDVFDHLSGRFLPYDQYIKLGIEVEIIPPLCVQQNATQETLTSELEKNFYLIPDGGSPGEGIVIKNYDYTNRYGRYAVAKMVRNEFKEKHNREQPTVKKFGESIENKICEQFVTEVLVDKVIAKITNENDGWNSKYIPRLLSTVYYDLINEELWNLIKRFKNPTIDFQKLNRLVTLRVKDIRPEVF